MSLPSTRYLLTSAALLLCNAAQAHGSLSDTDTEGHLAVAQEAIQLADWPLAQTELAIAQRADPRNADTYNLLGYVARKSPPPDLPKAFEHYQRALQLDPRHKGAHEYIGEAYLMDQQPDQAQKHLTALEEICGNRSCEEYEDLAKAIAAYRGGKP